MTTTKATLTEALERFVEGLKTQQVIDMALQGARIFINDDGEEPVAVLSLGYPNDRACHEWKRGQGWVSVAYGADEFLVTGDDGEIDTAQIDAEANRAHLGYQIEVYVEELLEQIERREQDEEARE